jgi:hypothetical protein
LPPLSLITKSEYGKNYYNIYNITIHRDYNDFKTAPDEKNKASAKTIDKHLFEIQGKNYGAIDIKINSLANRLAVSSIDSEVAVYNINPERKLEHYRDLSD